MFFQLFSTIKVNIMAKIMQSAYLCVMFHVKHNKNHHFSALTWLLILGEIQDCGQDGNHCWWSHRPPTAPPPIKYASSFREDKRLSTENKIVSQYCHKMKTLGGGVSISLPPTLYHDRGLNLRVRQRVKFHEHEWHPDCEQNVYSCSRVTSWLCMVTLFSVIFRAIAIITL